MYKVGCGWDIHRLTEGRKLTLGGVDIPYERGLIGHSDADALLHAVTDALLGALGKGDIGELFPDTDPRYKDISSVKLLESAVGMLAAGGYSVVNVDTVVIVQEPNLTPFKKMMRRSLAGVLGCAESCVSIKAKTQEGLGACGRGEAIAAHAVILLEGGQR
ncbi:MAG: 2-C-methyl-D-erythritol 2,4-cyclodiphosphate synthase [Candidatus Omnitrophica bacterium]|nr:2-C-methyl-D-erythritol 2,4-cyclodiphosphate synthase [Candidatus Omnitrophota bacterium]